MTAIKMIEKKQISKAFEFLKRKLMNEEPILE